MRPRCVPDVLSPDACVQNPSQSYTSYFETPFISCPFWCSRKRVSDVAGIKVHKVQVVDLKQATCLDSLKTTHLGYHGGGSSGKTPIAISRIAYAHETSGTICLQGSTKDLWHPSLTGLKLLRSNVGQLVIDQDHNV
ncbi:hypothetical protein NPIL_12871 [Nephila pilipes]|uniref:Uncharacterized protein n=1 Tax=Nephila pilipes TaxID=299642 RepID=A0A8X6UG84_NEPPI|nr:hypothetical protein NPIL_12871 [Nephila pilipes]